MQSKTKPAPVVEFQGLDPELEEELPNFEIFFKTIGFRRLLGRVWGLLVLAGQPLSPKEVSSQLGISQGATSTALNELAEWGAVTSTFDAQRRCHLHAPVGNALSIGATVLRRREQVIFGQFKAGAERTLELVRKRYGRRDPRVLTLRSIISSCEIAESLMQLVFNAVGSALENPESLLSRAIHRALRIGMALPAKLSALEEDEPRAIEAPEASAAEGFAKEPDEQAVVKASEAPESRDG